MNTKRIVRWSIVLLLLLALPGLTGALAQGQEPAAKQLPVVTEMGESATAIPWVDNERNPNNTVAQVNWKPMFDMNVVWGGKIAPAGDVDYWAISWGDLYDYDRHCVDDGCTLENSLPVLIDIEAQSIGSPVDSYICLYSDDGFELSCNDDTDTLDSLLFYNLEYGRTYYLSVINLNGKGGSGYKYQVFASVPLLISAAAGGLGTGNVAGIPFQSGDILAWSDFVYGSNQHEEKWVMLFDLSDLNVKGNVTNLAAGWRNSDNLLLGFAANATLPGISGTVTPWEVVTFNPTQIGPSTQGTFQRWWNGKNQGLTLAAEKPDAIEWPAWNGNTQLRVSTTGKATVAGTGGTLRLADEDVGLWRLSDGKWSLDFDGSIDYVGIAPEDVIALSYGERQYSSDSYGAFEETNFLVFQGTARVTTESDIVDGNEPIDVTQKDIVEAEKVVHYGDYRYVSVAWHGPDHGWNYNIDAIDYLDRFMWRP